MSMMTTRTSVPDWRLRQPFRWKSVVGLLAILFVACLSAERVQLDRMAIEIGSFSLELAGLSEGSQIGRGVESVTRDMFPIAISEKRPLDLVEDFDANALPFWARIETEYVETTTLDPDTLQMSIITEEQRFLVQPIGYLVFVLGKMLETIEIAIWASLIAIIFSLPLAWLGSSNYSPHPLVYACARGFVSFLRSIPELISALFLVLAFGFGPIAGILALTFHSIGFLGKFYAEDVEAANVSPQNAMKAAGAGTFTILRIAVLPQVLPSYIGLSLYILDRNIRMATVIGLVGAGGIGQELKGRFDMFQYDRVGTILLVIFLTVVALDIISARFRKRLV